MSIRLVAVATALTVLLSWVASAQHDHSKLKEIPAKPGGAQNTPVVLKPVEGASIKILKPKKGQVFKGDKIPVEFAFTKGKRGHHAHAYVDGELMGMFESATGTLNGVKLGKHTLEMRVVADDHQTELNATDKVEFVVK